MFKSFTCSLKRFFKYHNPKDFKIGDRVAFTSKITEVSKGEIRCKIGTFGPSFLCLIPLNITLYPELGSSYLGIGKVVSISKHDLQINIEHQDKGRVVGGGSVFLPSSWVVALEEHKLGNCFSVVDNESENKLLRDIIICMSEYDSDGGNDPLEIYSWIENDLKKEAADKFWEVLGNYCKQEQREWTKYINGHSDVVGGALITNDKALLERLHHVQNSMGGVPGSVVSNLSK